MSFRHLSIHCGKDGNMAYYKGLPILTHIQNVTQHRDIRETKPRRLD